VTIFSGTTGNVLNTVWALGSSDTSYGKAMAGIGDYDGDGRADFAVGAPDDNGGAGRVVVYSGRTFAAITTFTGAAGSHFGTSIAPFGDYDGDGKADFAVGAPDHVYNGAAMGRVSVHGIRIIGGISAFGTGCPGVSGMPWLSWMASSQLMPGGWLAIFANSLSMQAPSLWIWGLSNTTANGQPLPLNLAPWGIQCQLLVSPDSITFAGPGTGGWSMNLPGSPTFAGVRLYVQLAGLDAAYPAGVGFSNGLEVLIGHP
jgi:hypothetical protein